MNQTKPQQFRQAGVLLVFGVPPLGPQCNENHFHLCCFSVGHMKRRPLVLISWLLPLFALFILSQLLIKRPMLDQKQTYIRTVYVVVCFIRVRHRGWDLLCNERVLTMVGKSREILRKKPRFSTGPGNGLRIPYVQWNVTYNYILELYWSLLW